jgi:hypothetical protein
MRAVVGVWCIYHIKDAFFYRSNSCIATMTLLCKNIIQCGVIFLLLRAGLMPVLIFRHDRDQAMASTTSNPTPVLPVKLAPVLPTTPVPLLSTPPRRYLLVLVSTGGSMYSKARQDEIVLSITANQKQVQQHLDDVMHLAVDGTFGAYLNNISSSIGIDVKAYPAQPTFRDLFSLANKQAEWHGYTHVLLMHGDMMLSQDFLPCLMKSLPTELNMYALTRHPHPVCPIDSGGGVTLKKPSNLR